LGNGNRLRQSTVKKLMKEELDVRLHEVRQTRDKDIFDVLDLEQPVPKVALRFHTLRKKAVGASLSCCFIMMMSW